MLRDKALHVTVLSYLAAIALLTVAEILTGCSAASGYEPDTTTIKAKVASQIAFHDPKPVHHIKPQTTCTKCKGTKQVKSGDGHEWVACPCGEKCQCSRENSREPLAASQDNRLVVTIYNAKGFYCRSCDILKNDLHLIPQVRFVEHTGTEPAWIEAYPTLHWVGDDGEEYQLASGDINRVKTKLKLRNPSLFPDEEPVQQAQPQTYYYENYQPTRRGRRFFYSGCSSGRCR